jgi:hypothetical protein
MCLFCLFGIAKFYCSYIDVFVLLVWNCQIVHQVGFIVLVNSISYIISQAIYNSLYRYRISYFHVQLCISCCC